MRKSTVIISLIASSLLLASAASAGAIMQDMAEASEVAPDPKKKKVGEECKKSDECQRHHACSKAGDKTVCTAPPRPKLPPGVVT